MIDWTEIKSLENLKNEISKTTDIPLRLENNELHMLVNNRNFKTYEEDLGENTIIKIKDFVLYDYNIKFTLTAERDEKELISLTNYFDTAWDDYTDDQIWHKVVEKLIELDIIFPEDLEFKNYTIFYPYFSEHFMYDRVYMKIMKDVFGDFEDINIINKDITCEEFPFWIDTVFFKSKSTASVMVLTNHKYDYTETFDCNLFDLKEKMLRIRNKLEELGICKKRKTNSHLLKECSICIGIINFL